jgi:hypothetical protein
MTINKTRIQKLDEQAGQVRVKKEKKERKEVQVVRV